MNDNAKMCHTLMESGPDEQRQHERRERLHVLRSGQQPAPVVPIGNDPANEHEEQDRQLAQEVVDAQEEFRLRQVVDQQALRVLLHPRADRRAKRRKPEQPEIAMGQRAGDPCDPASRRFGAAAGSVAEGEDTGLWILLGSVPAELRAQGLGLRARQWLTAYARLTADLSSEIAPAYTGARKAKIRRK